jgi:hypothetical protein
MMLQTPTSPPPNNNAAAAAAATAIANISANMMTPCRMPVAATTPLASTMLLSSRTTGVTMTSTVGAGASGSGVPIPTTGRSVARMNQNITFASLGAGGRQQNSGNSAGLQPTTQSNLGTNAGLVGGFGAIYLGSTSTTTGTSGYSHVPRKKSNTLMLSLYSGSINPSSSTGVTKYNNFVESLYNKRINCTVGNCNIIFAGLAKKAKQQAIFLGHPPGSYLRCWQDGWSSAHHQPHQLGKCRL